MGEKGFTESERGEMATITILFVSFFFITAVLVVVPDPIPVVDELLGITLTLITGCGCGINLLTG